MRDLKLYLETSVWNFYFADDAPMKKEVTCRFFDNLPSLPYSIYISDAVLQEIEGAQEQKRTVLSNLISRHQPTVLSASPEVEELAEDYLARGGLPPKALFDAYHIAYAATHELDFVVSWNLRHIANIRRQERVQAINLLNGYTKPLQLITPMEVSEDDRDEDGSFSG